MIDWTHPIPLSFYGQFWLLFPLAAAVAIVYKTVRTRNLRRLPVEILATYAMMLLGLGALGAVLWIVQAYWP